MKYKDYILTAWLSVLTIGFLAYQPDNSGLFFSDNEGATIAVDDIQTDNNKLSIISTNTSGPYFEFGGQVSAVRLKERASASAGNRIFDFAIPYNDGGARFLVNSAADYGTGAAFQCFGDSHSLYGGRLYFDGGAKSGANIYFRTWSGSGTGRTTRLQIIDDLIEVDNASFKVETASTPTGTAEAGIIYFDTDDNTFKGYDGTTWQALH